MHATTTTQIKPIKLNDRADVFHYSLYAPRVMGSNSGQPVTKPGTPLLECDALARAVPGWRVETEIAEVVTIQRPDRRRERRTYDLTKHSPTARRALAALLAREWADTGTTPRGWTYHTNA